MSKSKTLLVSRDRNITDAVDVALDLVDNEDWDITNAEEYVIQEFELTTQAVRKFRQLFNNSLVAV